MSELIQPAQTDEQVGERIVTIFGGAKCSESDAEYVQAQRVGQLLADKGFTICTGGYLGVMEAASRGAHERGGRVLGIVMNQFKAEPNRYLTDKVATPHFYERLQRLITRSIGFIAIRGGMGTVLSYPWFGIRCRPGLSAPGHWSCWATAGRQSCARGSSTWR